ncbi:MAG: putative RNA ligase 2 [Prokaryotic dsDNA virus sp.]|nr:MAG: putative RNA ligase 2 [Prokaryotic dsDNA virus sp.]
MFKKFNSLENAYREKFVNDCRELGASEWVALEKIHGANFGFIVEGGEVTPFKRSSTIGANPETGSYEFYGCNPVVDIYKNLVKNIELVFDQPVQIYGELYGEGVQKEIQYGPKDFIAFDIYLMDDEVFVDWDVVVKVCADYSIPTAPEIGRDTLEQLLKVSPEFDSIVSKRNGYDSKAEGLVIKQLQDEAFLRTGSRAIIKNKSKSFSEKKQKAPKKPFKMPEEVKGIFEDFLQYLNKNRFNNVISEIGEVSQKDFGKLQGLLVKDAKEEFERDEYEISSDDWKLIAKSVNKEAAGVVREDWLNILDNNY